MLVDYCAQMKDPMMMEPPVWFQSFCVCELLVQLPFFFPAAWAFFSGYSRLPCIVSTLNLDSKHFLTENNLWIRVPAIVYAAHVATTLIPILSYVYLNDFSTGKYPGPSTQQERLMLMGIYSPYLIIPVLMLLLFLFGGEHFQKSKKKTA
jgi:hypothetical protein